MAWELGDPQPGTTIDHLPAGPTSHHEQEIFFRISLCGISDVTPNISFAEAVLGNCLCVFNTDDEKRFAAAVAMRAAMF